LGGKAVLTGTPIREELFSGNKARGLEFTGLNEEKPIILVIGGSLGSAAINEAVRKALPELLKKYQVIHLCGKGKVYDSLNGTPGYVQYEYIHGELCDLLSIASAVISRAGANVICELAALNKPNILIPLPAASSRGDQILNAESFKKQGFSHVIQEENLTKESLLDGVEEILNNKTEYIENMKLNADRDSIKMIIDLINSQAQ
jgi:UDP-N-acetylglucosamine--N-acetylmuramyl-(pentapeptide) pyrophosphoryl-undecaprenol N-acetylglucosamine transferase